MTPTPMPASGEPFWKRLFTEGDFGWAFRMRAGDPREFFAPRDSGGPLLAEKHQWLETRPELYLVTSPGGVALVEEAWNLAIAWGHAQEPGDGIRDLAKLAAVWEPDLVFMDSTTAALAAGAVCFPSSWDPRHAIGKPVHAVHDMVPRLNDQIGDKIDRFLAQLPPGKGFCRENWSFTRSSELNYHPALGRARLDDTVRMEELFLRVEHQLFTAIPGGVLMGIRIATCPLADLSEDPETWKNAGDKIRTMPDDVAAYKSMLSARAAIVREMEKFRPFLD